MQLKLEVRLGKLVDWLEKLTGRLAASRLVDAIYRAVAFILLIALIGGVIYLFWPHVPSYGARQLCERWDNLPASTQTAQSDFLKQHPELKAGEYLRAKVKPTDGYVGDGYIGYDDYTCAFTVQVAPTQGVLPVLEAPSTVIPSPGITIPPPRYVLPHVGMPLPSPIEYRDRAGQPIAAYADEGCLITEPPVVTPSGGGNIITVVCDQVAKLTSRGSEPVFLQPNPPG